MVRQDELPRGDGRAGDEDADITPGPDLFSSSGPPVDPVPPSRLADLFCAFDRERMDWALLRPPEALAEREGDVDLLVNVCDLERASDIAMKQGFARVPSPRDLHAVDYDPASDRFLWLHVQTELRLGGETVPGPTLFEAVVTDPLPRLSDPWMMWTLLLHGLIDKGSIAERHRPRLTRLAQSAARDAGECALASIAAARGLRAEVVVPLLVAGAWEELERLRITPRESPPGRGSRGRFAGARQRVRLAWSRRGVGVAVIGPDGAGKTTLVHGLEGALPFPVVVLYMGLTGGRLRSADALRLPGVVFLARLVIVWTRYARGLNHRLRGRIVLFDRYVLDGTVPSGVRQGPLGRGSRRLQAAACPRPDLILLLDASGASMHRRKGGYDPEILESWRVAYGRLRGSRRVEVLDAERSADAVLRDAKALIWRCYAARWRSSAPP